MITRAQLREILSQYNYSATGRTVSLSPQQRKERRAQQQRAWYERNKHAQHHRQKQRRFRERMGE